jgi:hypothetical protein
MVHTVTRNLVLRASAAGTPEWSKGIPIGQDNAAMFEATLRSHSGASAPTVTLKLQGSNDLAKWVLITQATTSTIPIVKKVKVSESQPYEYLRLAYVATHATLTPNVTIAATIHTYRTT